VRPTGSPYIKLVVEAIEQTAKWVLGTDPRKIRTFLSECDDRGWHHYPHIGHMASAAIEMALWDIVGKAAGMPLHQFFGGAVRERVDYYWYMTVLDRTPAGVRKQAREGVSKGFKTVYMKVGFDIDDDIALIREIRDEVGPKVGIRVDPNEGWSAFDARRALQELESVGLEYVEEPIDMNKPRCHARPSPHDDDPHRFQPVVVVCAQRSGRPRPAGRRCRGDRPASTRQPLGVP